MSPRVAYRAVERFDREHPGWAKYLVFARNPSLVEVVSLDTMLCPNVIPPEAEWDGGRPIHGLPCAEIAMSGFFEDLDWLRARVGVRTDAMILRVVQQPTDDDLVESPSGFRFEGFDLLDDGLTSALTNCGGIDELLPHQAANGLIPDARVARELCDELERKYGDVERHRVTDVWAIWRLER